MVLLASIPSYVDQDVSYMRAMEGSTEDKENGFQSIDYS